MVLRSWVCNRSLHGFHTAITTKNLIGKNAEEVQLVTVNFNKHSRVPTIQIKLCESTPYITFMLDTDSGPNIIKENFISRDITQP